MRTIICFIISVTIGVAKDGDVYVYKSSDYYSKFPVAKQKPSFTFGYHSGDMLSMQIYLKNLSSKLSADVNVTYPSDVTMDKKQIVIYKNEKYFEIHHVLKSSKIFVELELSITAGFCTRQKVVEGTYVTRIPDEVNDTPYEDICLRDEPCLIEVDLLHNICEDVKTTSNSFIIISSLSGVAFIVLAAVITISKRCWIKLSLQGTPLILPTNQNSEPLYLNMLFRRECDQEMAEIDNHYVEINPRVTEGSS